MDNNNQYDSNFPRIELTDGKGGASANNAPQGGVSNNTKGTGTKLIDGLKNIKLQPYWSFGVASFVLGILAIVFIWAEGIAYIPSIIGLILAIVAKKKGNTSGFVTAGLWLNIIPIVGTTIIILLTFGLCGTMMCAAAGV